MRELAYVLLLATLTPAAPAAKDRARAALALAAAVRPADPFQDARPLPSRPKKKKRRKKKPAPVRVIPFRPAPMMFFGGRGGGCGS